jgi:hypothetical protein
VIVSFLEASLSKVSVVSLSKVSAVSLSKVSAVSLCLPRVYI